MWNTYESISMLLRWHKAMCRRRNISAEESPQKSHPHRWRNKLLVAVAFTHSGSHRHRQEYVYVKSHDFNHRKHPRRAKGLHDIKLSKVSTYQLAALPVDNQTTHNSPPHSQTNHMFNHTLYLNLLSTPFRHHHFLFNTPPPYSLRS